MKRGPEENANSAVHSVTDEVLLTRLQAGEQEALGCLFQRYARIVHSVAARILRDAAEAEDLVQDLFLFVQRKCSIFDSTKSSAGSWIVQMAYQRSIERRRYLTTLPVGFLQHLDLHKSVYGYIGLEDYTLFPLIRPGSLVQIDASQRKISTERWKTEFDRPVYFVELRNGYVCSWCQVDRGQLMIIPHPHSHQDVRRFDYPSQAEIVGRVTGVAMRIVGEKSPEPGQPPRETVR